MARKRLGEVLLEQGLIDEEDLQEALEYKEKSGYRLGTALVALRIIAEWQLTEALGKTLELPVVDLSAIRPTQAALRKIPSRLAERFDLIPLRLSGRGSKARLVVAMSDPLNRPVISRMEDVAGCAVEPVLASLSAIQRAIRIHYHKAAPGEVLGEANRLRTTESDPADLSRQLTINQLRREAESLRGATRIEPSPPRASPPEPSLALECKFRALLYLLLEKKAISGRDYADKLAGLLDRLEGKSK
ncbi:MAG: hypothetical protein JXR96_25830 [Deltaproteobacteria bacterium]|nr:hypothetical protein [Deltaproteobacteria bacterium]